MPHDHAVTVHDHLARFWGARALKLAGDVDRAQLLGWAPDEIAKLRGKQVVAEAATRHFQGQQFAFATVDTADLIDAYERLTDNWQGPEAEAMLAELKRRDSKE